MRRKRTLAGGISSTITSRKKQKDESRSNYFGNISNLSNLGAFSSIEFVNDSLVDLTNDNTKETPQRECLATTTSIEQDVILDLSIYNDVIAANLQKYYHEDHEWSALDVCIYQHLDEICNAQSNEKMKSLNNEDVRSESQEHVIKNTNYLINENNELDNEILRTIMDLDQDGTVSNENMTSSTACN